MTKWHRTLTGDLAIRAVGTLLLALCWLVISALMRAASGRIAHSAAMDYLLAAVGFLSASAGTASVILGRHLFDDIEVSPRWRRSSSPSSRGDA
jgi:hypothetical protein